MHCVRTALCLTLIAFATLASCAMAAVAPAKAVPNGRLVVSGSLTMAALVTDIARRFEGSNPGVTTEIRTGSSGKGLADLRADTADIAMVARQLTANERGLFAFPLCRDGAAIVVHRSNPVRGLNRRQLTELLTGNIVDWKEFGARPGPIKLVWRSEGHAIAELLLQHLKLTRDQVRGHAAISENNDAIDFAANDPHVITVAPLGVAERSAKAGAAVKLLAYEGVAASSRAVRERTYPLSRPLTLVTRGVPDGLQKRFVDYAVSDAVSDLHAKHGFVPYQD